MFDFSQLLLIFVSATSLIYAILALLGKDFIIDDVFLKATPEERESMEKKPFRIQAAIVCFCIFIVTLLNFLWSLFGISWIIYISCAVCVIGIIYFIKSHKALKKKYGRGKTE